MPSVSSLLAGLNDAFDLNKLAEMVASGEIGAILASLLTSMVMGDSPTERKGTTSQLFATLIACATREMILSTPYFMPDATVPESPCAAALRVEKVTLIFTARNDSWIVAGASRSYYRRLLESGCEIHEFEGGLLHAKTLTVDGTLSLIGSTNLDLRSFDLNYEKNILLQDTKTTGNPPAK